METCKWKDAVSMKVLQRDQEGYIRRSGKVPQASCTCLHGRENQRMRYGHISMVILVGLQICWFAWLGYLARMKLPVLADVVIGRVIVIIALDSCYLWLALTDMLSKQWLLSTHCLAKVLLQWLPWATLPVKSRFSSISECGLVWKYGCCRCIT